MLAVVLVGLTASMALAVAAPAVGGPHLLCAFRTVEYDVPTGHDCVLVTDEGKAIAPRLYQTARHELREERLVFGLDGLYGYGDFAGNTVVKPQFDRGARPFFESRAAVCVRLADNKPDQCGFIDPNGTWAIRLAEQSWAGDFHDGRAWVQVEGRSIHYIDRAGLLVAPASGPFDFSSGRGIAEVKTGGTTEYVYIDRDGRPVPEFGKLDRPMPFRGRFAAARKGGVTGVFDAQGKFTPLFYSKDGLRASDFSLSPDNEGYALIEIQGGPWSWGVLDSQPKLLLGPVAHDKMRLLDTAVRNGVLPVRVPRSTDRVEAEATRNKVRFIRPDGSAAFDADFRQAHGFFEGLAAAVPMAISEREKYRWGFIDDSGRWVIAPQYDDVVRDFRDGCAVVGRNRNEILIDRAGREIADYASVRRSIGIDPDPLLAGIDPCAIENEVYLSRAERAEARAALTGALGVICRDEGLRARRRELSVLQHQRLAAGVPRIEVALERIENFDARLGDQCQADHGCASETLRAELLDPSWQPPPADQSKEDSEYHVFRDTRHRVVPRSLRQRLLRRIRRHDLYLDPPEATASHGVSFSYFDMGGNRRGILATQDVPRYAVSWLFAPGPKHPLVLSAEGVLMPQEHSSNGYVDLEVRELGNVANSTFYRFDGSVYAPFMTCRVGYLDGDGSDNMVQILHGCSRPQDAEQ